MESLGWNSWKPLADRIMFSVLQLGTRCGSGRMELQNMDSGIMKDTKMGTFHGFHEHPRWLEEREDGRNSTLVKEEEVHVWMGWPCELVTSQG